MNGIGPSARTVRWVDDHVMHGYVFPWLIAFGRRFPSTIRPLNRVVGKTLEHARRVGRSDLMLSTPMPVVHRESEAAMSLARGGEAIDRLVRLVDREALRVMFPAEMRFVRGDATWMSPAEGRDTCQLGAYAAGDDAEVDGYLAGFWREMRELGARPHWGKEMDHGAEEIRALYPHAERFAALREAFDPGRVFTNAFLTRVLGA